MCDCGNGAVDVSDGTEDTCGDADGNVFGDNNDPDDTAVDLEGVWAENKVTGVCTAETWYFVSLCELDANLVCRNSVLLFIISPPWTMPALLTAYSKKKKKKKKKKEKKEFKKIIC